MKKFKKKGQQNGAVGAIIGLIVGVGVAVLVLIFVGALGGQAYNIVEDDILEIGNQTATAQSFTANNATAQFLGNINVHTGSLSIYNASGNTFGLANFTVNYNTGTALLSDSLNGVINGSTYLANYSWGQMDIQDSVRTSITSGFEALESTGDYTPIIVLAVVIALVLTLVLGFTSLSGGNSGSAL